MKYKLLFAEIWAYNVYRRPVRTDKVAMNIIKTQANKSYTCIGYQTPKYVYAHNRKRLYI